MSVFVQVYPSSPSVVVTGLSPIISVTFVCPSCCAFSSRAASAWFFVMPPTSTPSMLTPFVMVASDACAPPAAAAIIIRPPQTASASRLPFIFCSLIRNLYSFIPAACPLLLYMRKLGIRVATIAPARMIAITAAMICCLLCRLFPFGLRTVSSVFFNLLLIRILLFQI